MAGTALSSRNRHPLLKHLLSLLIVGLASALQWGIYPLVRPAPGILFFPAVILASLYGSSLSAILFSAFAMQYAFVDPVLTLKLRWPEDVLRLAAFILSAYTIRMVTQSLGQALRRSTEAEHQLEVILAHVTDGITVLDGQGRFVYVNEPGARLCGFATPKEMLEASNAEVMSRFEILTEQGEPFPISELPGRKALRGESPSGEAIVRSRNRLTGRESWSSVTAAPVLSPQGKVLYAISVFRDFTEQRSYEENFKERERKFRTLADAMPQLVWITDDRGDVDYVNRRWFEYTGQAESRSRDIWVDATHPEDLERVMAAHLSALEARTEFAVEYRLRRRDGQYRWHLARTVFANDPGDGGVKRIGTATDIHESRMSQDLDRFMAESSKALVSSLDYETTLSTVASLAVPEIADWCAVDMLDERGELKRLAVAHKDPAKIDFAYELQKRYPPDLSASRGVGKILRTGRSELISDIPEELLIEAAVDEEHLKVILALTIRSYMGVPIQVKGRTLGVLTFVQAESGRRYTGRDLAMAEELGRRASLAIENAHLFKQAQDAVRARDEFLSIASHELKTPLTSLQLQAQMRMRGLQRGEKDAFSPERLLKMVEGDARQIRRLSRLIEDMLDIARINTGKLTIQRETFDLCELVQEVLERYGTQLAASGSPIRLECLDEAKGEWDRFRIEQVIVNLLTNAQRYGEGRPVTVEVRRQGDQALFSVADQGMGIAPENHERIFQRFERAVVANEISGMGLGLFIVRQIVDMHGGSIRLESSLGQGSVFTVSLPLGKPLTQPPEN